MANVRYQEVVKRFGETLVIPGFDLDIADKEFLVLVGPSGCGKSTLLRLLAGLEELTAGGISIDDRPVNDLPPKDRDIAMVFQNYALYPHMNVRRNMAFGLKMRKFGKDEIDQRVREAARILEIEHLLDRKPAQLSGGQRQRVAMGRAIVRKPKVFLFDEPLSNLDAKLRVQMRLEIKALHRRLQTTIVYVTHDQVEAMTLADRIAIVHEGELQQVDTPNTVYNRPVNCFVAGFIGSPTMNFVPAQVIDGRVDAGVFSLPVPQHMEKPSGDKVQVGIRPEHICVVPHPEREEIAVQATAELIEELGSHSIVYTVAGDHRLGVSVDLATHVQPGEPITLYIDLSQVHIFDESSGNNLTLRSTGAVEGESHA